jgi:hypothetical protein
LVSFGTGQDGCGEPCGANGLYIGQFDVFSMVAKAVHESSSGRPNPSSSASDGMITLQILERLRRDDPARARGSAHLASDRRRQMSGNCSAGQCLTARDLDWLTRAERRGRGICRRGRLSRTNRRLGFQPSPILHAKVKRLKKALPLFPSPTAFSRTAPRKSRVIPFPLPLSPPRPPPCPSARSRTS